jgi:hypothetical protein
MIELRTLRIGNLGRVVTGKTPPSSQSELFGDAYPFLTPTDIDGCSRYIESARYISLKGYDHQRQLVLPQHAICVVCIGATISKICMTRRSSFTNQQVNSIVVNENEHDPFFVWRFRNSCGSVAGLAHRSGVPPELSAHRDPCAGLSARRSIPSVSSFSRLAEP